MTDPDGTELWYRALQMTQKIYILKRAEGIGIYMTDIKEKWCNCGSACTRKKCVRSVKLSITWIIEKRNEKKKENAYMNKYNHESEEDNYWILEHMFDRKCER